MVALSRWWGLSKWRGAPRDLRTIQGSSSEMPTCGSGFRIWDSGFGSWGQGLGRSVYGSELKA